MQSFVFQISGTGTASAGVDASAAGNGFRTVPSAHDGLSGDLRLQNVQSLQQDEVLKTLENLDAIICWAQAQQARTMNRLEALVARDTDPSGELTDTFGPEAYLRIAASEVGALLSLPPMTAQRLMFDSAALCTECPAVLAELEAGRISYRKAQIVCSTVASLPEASRSALESRLLEAAPGLTAAQLDRQARRLYERMVPEAERTVRQRSARNDRRVALEAQPDGMCFLGARLPAVEGQAIFTGLTTCARSERAAGDPRSVDQLRADILTSLLLGAGDVLGSGTDEMRPGADGVNSGMGERRFTGSRVPSTAGKDSDGARGASESGIPKADGVSVSARPLESAPGHSASNDGGRAASRRGTSRRGAKRQGSLGPRIKAEVMVLLTAETLLGLDDRPAELQGYRPIDAEAARGLVRSIGHWTGLLRSGRTGEILDVGRQRRIPPGLRRWLQARDATCRFPGCSANALNAEIDHTVPWARGGPTAHGNLECLCRKHHAFKTAGFWKAEQPTPGVLEWTSPAGRRYITRPHLDLKTQLDLEKGVPVPADAAPPPF